MRVRRVNDGRVSSVGGWMVRFWVGVVMVDGGSFLVGGVEMCRCLCSPVPTLATPRSYENQDLSRNLSDELQGNITLLTQEEIEQANTLSQEQDEGVINHQGKVRKRMAERYSKQHEIEVFSVDQIVNLKMPMEDRSTLDDRRIFARLLRFLLKSNTNCNMSVRYHFESLSYAVAK